MPKYTKPTIPPDESERLKELRSLRILDTEREERFDRIVKLVASIFNVPIVLISLVDANRQWFKSCIGLTVNETSRDVSFCAHALFEKEILVIPDATKDKRFAGNPLVVGEPYIKFYAGAVLRGPTGQPLGTLCIIDAKSKKFSDKDEKYLIQFAQLIEHELRHEIQLKLIRQEIEQTLYFDPLTGLPNKRLLMERLAQAIEFLPAKDQIAVITLKINRLKELNSAYGKKALEFVIHELVIRLKKQLGETTNMACFEEDKFVTFLHFNPGETSLPTKLQTILSIFENVFSYQNTNHKLDGNIGASIYPIDAKDAATLIESSLYAANLKISKNNLQYHFYSDEATKRFSTEYEMETRLLKAIENESLEIMYMPKVDVYTGFICGVHTLCRWKDTKFGEVQYPVLIALAEKSDLINSLGDWLLRKACQQQQAWQNESYRKFPISVNIFRRQLMRADIAERLRTLLQLTNVAPPLLELEITELFLTNMDEILLAMNAIRSLGINFSLANLGEGSSSLTNIQHLPLSTLKISSLLISGIAHDKRSAAIVRALIAVSKSLNLVSVAQGVVSADELLCLRAYQCDQFQGKFFSDPLTADAFNQLLARDEHLTA